MEKVDDFLDRKFEEINSDDFKVLCYDVYDLKDLLLEFGRQVCEEQKQECLNKAESHFTYSGFVYSNDDSGYKDVETYIKKESILNCKNVCNI